ncbi:hypothetical protein QAD02_015532 [Eretmocerus hayati]|uniref:Uncharacterized protein n=1 Tax=Eretmocerus hayati TaxID=131215 RepID=A0ACC2P8J7_9HYME|nr:hypothetical protein QAD02_015532 [Eretmocerus hayati]
MSFCIRGVSNGGRYVPSIVTSAQGCAAREFSGRQISKNVKLTPFLNEFLASNVPLSAPFSNGNSRISNVAKGSSQNTYILPGSTYSNDVLNSAVDYHDERNDNSYILNFKHSDKLTEKSLAGPQIQYTKDQLLFSSMAIPNYDIMVMNRQGSHGRAEIINVSPLIRSRNQVEFSTPVRNATNLKSKASPNASEEGQYGKASQEDLEYVYKTLSADLPKFFGKSVDYRIYDPQIEFVNNIRGTTTKGMYEYVKQLALVRAVGHLKYAYVKLEVLKITMHTSNSTVRVRWRISGISGFRVMFTFWKYKIWKIKESLQESERWHDGFSTYYVGSDGKVFRHVVDKVVPDDSEEEVKTKTGIPPKLASELTCSGFH